MRVRQYHSGMSLEEIGCVLGMTKQAVFQIEKKAIAKVRRALGSSFTGPIGPFLCDLCGRREISEERPWSRGPRKRTRLAAGE